MPRRLRLVDAVSEMTTGTLDQRMAMAEQLRARLLQGVEYEERWRDVAGTKTLVLSCGVGSPLILLHGGIECGGVYWSPVMAELARSHRLIVPDVPGLGESTAADRIDDATFATWFSSLIEQTCDDPPAVVAHSLNGSLAARFAVSSEGLRQLVIYAAPGIGPYHMPWGLRIVAVRFALRPTERNAERFDRWAFADYDAMRARDPGWMEAFSQYTRSRATIGHVKRTMRQLIGIGTRRVTDDRLRHIAAPVALLWPRDDRFVPIALAQNTSERLGWPLHVIDLAGHAAHIERPATFIRELREALAEENSATSV
jgi:2-hydroxymuconate-semialdehyde hydrolase